MKTICLIFSLLGTGFNTGLAQFYPFDKAVQLIGLTKDEGVNRIKGQGYSYTSTEDNFLKFEKMTQLGKAWLLIAMKAEKIYVVSWNEHLYYHPVIVSSFPTSGFEKQKKLTSDLVLSASYSNNKLGLVATIILKRDNRNELVLSIAEMTKADKVSAAKADSIQTIKLIDSLLPNTSILKSSYSFVFDSLTKKNITFFVDSTGENNNVTNYEITVESNDEVQVSYFFYKDGSMGSYTFMLPIGIEQLHKYFKSKRAVIKKLQEGYYSCKYKSILITYQRWDNKLRVVYNLSH